MCARESSRFDASLRSYNVRIVMRSSFRPKPYALAMFFDYLVYLTPEARLYLCCQGCSGVSVPIKLPRIPKYPKGVLWNDPIRIKLRSVRLSGL